MTVATAKLAASDPAGLKASASLWESFCERLSTLSLDLRPEKQPEILLDLLAETMFKCTTSVSLSESD